MAAFARGVLAAALGGVVAAALAACNGGHATPDAAADAYDWGDVAVIGRVCTVLDYRYPFSCTPGQDVAGLRVEELTSGASVMTVDDGSFGLDLSGPGPAILRVTGDAGGQRRTSLVSVPLVNGKARDVIVPSVSVLTWQQFVAYLHAPDDPARDTIIMNLVNGSAAAQGLVVTPPDTTTGPTFYDDGGAFDWKQNIGTQDHGVAISFGVPATGPASVLIRDLAQGSMATVDGLPVGAGALTFDKVDVSQSLP